MNLIDDPQTLAERILNAVCADIYQRSGGDYWFDGIPDDVLKDEFIPELLTVIQTELDKG